MAVKASLHLQSLVRSCIIIANMLSYISKPLYQTEQYTYADSALASASSLLATSYNMLWLIYSRDASLHVAFELLVAIRFDLE